MLNHAIKQNGDTLSGSDFSYKYNTSTKNNHGTAVLGASTKSKTLGNEAFNDQPLSVFGSKPTYGTTNGLSNVKAISGGTFAHNHTKPISAYITNERAGVALTSVTSPAGTPALIQSIHKLETVTTNRTATAFRTGFNFYTGHFSGSITTADDSMGNDVAARPTRSVPGQLVYQIGGQVPATANYKAKTDG
jgi:hypothetical protein